MLSEEELEAAVHIMIDRLNGVNRLFIRKVAEQIQTLGELNASSIHTLNTIADMGADIAEVTKALSDATALNIKDLMQLYQKALDDAVANPAFQRYIEEQEQAKTVSTTPTPTPPPEPAPQDAQTITTPEPLKAIRPEVCDRVVRLTQYIAAQTAGKMINLSNTTVISEPYRETVDNAVLAVTAGYQSYDQAKREAIRKLGGSGLQVLYESGHRRRLDTAVRQNVINGARQIGQQATEMIAEELGVDARQIDAHPHSAPDHEPVQGRVFLKAEFDKMQAGLSFSDIDGNHYEGFRRPIGEWNCRHYVGPFDPKTQKRKWSNEQLDQWKKENAEGCTIGGKHMTIYQATQYMRRLETRIRREKDIAVAAKDAGDMTLRQECQKNIDAYAAQYKQVADAAGLRQDRERMSVEGFRRVKV